MRRTHATAAPLKPPRSCDPGEQFAHARAADVAHSSHGNAGKGSQSFTMTNHFVGRRADP